MFHCASTNSASIFVHTKVLTNRVYNHLRCIQNPHLPGSLLGKEDAAVQDWLPFISPFIVFGTAPPWLEPAASAAWALGRTRQWWSRRSRRRRIGLNRGESRPVNPNAAWRLDQHLTLTGHHLPRLSSLQKSQNSETCWKVLRRDSRNDGCKW